MKKRRIKKTNRIDSRTIIVTAIFVVVLGFLGVLGVAWILNIESLAVVDESVPASENNLVATIEIVDENANATGGILSKKINQFVAQCEMDFWELGYKVVKAVIPVDAVREIDLYIAGYNGYAKTVTDRGAGVAAEDFDRMVRYLKGIGVEDFEYIDVRTEGKGYYK